MHCRARLTFATTAPRRYGEKGSVVGPAALVNTTSYTILAAYHGMLE